MRYREIFLLASLTLLISCGDNGSPTRLRSADTRAACFDLAVFDDPATSPYCLPYAVGTSYSLFQSYCSPPGWSHMTRFAYDFDMPLGTEVLAARAGKVVELREHFSDDDRTGGHENTVILRHDDNTLGLYIHMMQDGVLVEMGDFVPRGALLGWSGISGDTNGFAHLHFQVCLKAGKCSYQTEEITLPVNFSNAQGALDPAGGLIAGETYLALPCS